MRTYSRVLPLLLGIGACAPGAPTPADPPKAPAHQAGTDASPDLGVALEVEVAHRDERSGAPTFAWLSTAAPVPAALGPEAVGRAVLRGLLGRYAAKDALRSAVFRAVHDTGRGVVIVEFEQVVDGHEVFQGGVRVGLSRELAPLVASGTLYPEVRRLGATWDLGAERAIARAAERMTGADLAALGVTKTGEGEAGYAHYRLPAFTARDAEGRLVRTVAARPARLKRVWYPQPGGLLPAYYVELDLGTERSTDSELRAFVISARDGAVLFEHGMTAADSYSYRVWADPAPGFVPWDSPQGNSYTPYPASAPNGSDPPYVRPALVTLQNAPFTRNDPWLPPGAAELSGNNARAYADVTAPDGFNDGDVLVTPTAPGVFDHTYDPTTEPQGTPEASQAVTTQLFYVVNFMHDYFYDAGWNEVSRNPQLANLGRGGAQGDPIKAEAQDSSGRNNANASTPADGSSPRIQMYLYDSYNGPRGVAVTAPAGLVGAVPVVPARVGPRAFEVSQTAVLVDDGSGAANDGCETPFLNAAEIAGKIAVLDAGTCGFPLKAYNAQRNGAVGVLIVNDTAALMQNPLASTPSAPGTVTIPTQGLQKADGDRLKTALAAGTAVELTMSAAPIDRDGALDLSISAHEWTHVMTNRLIGNGSGLSEVQARGMGEGWSDFVANLALTRPEDASHPANPGWSGSWAHAQFANSSPGNDAHYHGNRRYPISTDLSKNPLTFKHIQNGVPLPTTPAPRSGQSGANNAEVHATGEVWAEMLWECYAALLRDTARYTFAAANQRMREYLVAALKLTPSKPTFLEARDALLVAAYAGDPRDHTLFYQAFARRGAGVGATGPQRTSTDNVPVGESFAAGHDLVFVSAKLDDSADPCDADGVLDEAEIGKLTVTVRNTGAGALTAAKVTAATTLAGVSFPSGATATFPSIAPYQTGTATLLVALAPQSPPVTAASGRFTLTLADPALAVPRTIEAGLDATLHFDDKPSTSTQDSMDAPTTPWSTSGDAALSTLQPFRRDFVGQDGHWHINGNPAASDQYLVSPPLELQPTGSAVVTFKHRYRFEVSTASKYFDGGVLEISRDNGATWSDIGERITDNGYTAELDPKNLVLGGRQAFAGESAGYPDYRTTTVTLDEADAGKTVLLRFRAATDPSTGTAGWDIDDFAVQGLVNKPFGSRGANSGVCKNRAPVARAGDAQTVTAGATVRLAGSASDRDGDRLTLAWTQAGGPSVVLSDRTAATPTFTAPEVTERARVVLSLVANDGTLNSAPSTVEITVDPAPGAPPPSVTTPPAAGAAPVPEGEVGGGCAVAPHAPRTTTGALFASLGGLLLAWRRRRARRGAGTR